MKMVVIGQSVVDKIKTDDGSYTKPGGIFYSVLGLLQIGKIIEEIILITNYSEKYKELFSSTFDKVNIKLSTKVKNIPTVNLRIWKDKERDEIYSNVTQRLKIPLEKNLNKYDGILVNMISGFDLRITEFEKLRENYSGLIYLDVHSLARGIDENKNRKFRKIPSIKRWLNCADIVQCNENELLTLYESNNEKEIANFVFKNKPRVLIITKGNRGATVYPILNNSEVFRIDVAPIKITSKNSVGCGDIFGATFFYFYVKLLDINEALKKANIAAGLFTQYSSIEEFQKLEEEFTNYYA
ncbi:MAG: carbohydrate kinase family protein [Ignavibacteriae bacterium]|nr:carbohydrate kinase family protein [Ignavibacteriota bacterium]